MPAEREPAVTINGHDGLNAFWSAGLDAVVLVLPFEAARALRSALHEHLTRRAVLTGQVFATSTDEVYRWLDRAIGDRP